MIAPRKPSPLKLEIPNNIQYITILASPPVQELDVIGPVQVFAGANQVLEGRGLGYHIEVITVDEGCVVAGAAGVSLIAHRNYREIRRRIDTLLIASGPGAQMTHTQEVLKWLGKTARRVRRLGSICTGAFLLAEAGLLNGRRATTHWMFAHELAERYPHVAVDPNPIWVQDGNVYTSAGMTAGMDLALGLVEEDFGVAVALAVARGLVLFLRRPGGQTQFSVALSKQASERKPLQELQVWITENLNQSLSVEILANRVAMSPRHFARVFAHEIGVTPARYVERLRIEAARRQLEQTNKSLEEIAFACGFGSGELMRRAFLRTLHITPGRHRDHFQSTTTTQ